FKIRVGMMNPMYMPKIRDGLLKSFQNSKVFKFLHVPVQSGSDKVLNGMKRGHTAKTFIDAVDKFRTNFSKFTISTDIIVGFPSETEDDFQKTIDLLNTTQPDIVNLSRYSKRPGTEAAKWKQVDVSEVKRRSKIIFDLINEISYENNKKWIGWKGEVLFDEKSEDGIKGRNFTYKPIFVKEKVEIGQNHRVEIIDSTNHILIGKNLS
ncbi:MAG: radical SAM protein, partial [Nitrosopumilaceae archaeon]